MTREDVLKEFGIDQWDAMADEIVRLREIVERTEWEREQAWQVTQQQERILAALREPSEAVIEAALNECPGNFPADDSDVRDSIRAAVAAAEKEAA